VILTRRDGAGVAIAAIPRGAGRTDSEVTTMAIVRIIYTNVPSDQSAEAEKDWKEECAPLMIRQPGCRAEKLLRCIDNPGEYISYSEWTDLASIEAYLQSDDHQEIKRRTSCIKGATVVVRHYEMAG
jgi:heme-degrading monooxygenase HmoA